MAVTGTPAEEAYKDKFIKSSPKLSRSSIFAGMEGGEG